MFDEQSRKTLLIFMFYGLVIAMLAWLGYLTAKFTTKIGSNIGSLVGGLAGFGLAVFLWFKIGEKYAGTTAI